MSKSKFKPFWSFDVLKTQGWLNDMRENGYKLREVSPFLRIFRFDKETPASIKHLIFYEKDLNGYPKAIVESGDYDQVCYTKNFYVVEENSDNPELTPTYDVILSRNQKIKYVVGNILLFLTTIYGFGLLSILFIILRSDGITVTEVESTPTGIVEVLSIVFAMLANLAYLFILIWMVYAFFKLRKSNKELAKLCGEDIDLAFTVPTDTILSKEEINRLKKEKRIFKKMKIGWFYAPDKCERWIEQKGEEGYNLLRMSKMGNSFYFVKGNNVKMKYHIDFQKKKDSTYFKMNEESGWKLYFTSITRFFAISLWGHAYEETLPEFYSDNESKVKHAKTLMLSYVVWMLPISLMYFTIFAYTLSVAIETHASYISGPMIFAGIMMLIAGIEFLYFSFKLIRYYNRIKDGVKT